MSHDPADAGSPAGSGSFERDARHVLVDLQAVLRTLIAALPGAIQRPRDLEKALGIDRTLAWKVMRFAQSADPLAAAQHLPRNAALRNLFRAAERRGLDGGIAGTATSVLERLERLIDTHAGDRACFDMMLIGGAPDDDGRRDIPYRRAAYVGNSYLLGWQARAQLSMHILHPSAEAGFFDYVGVRGFIDLRRIRPSLPWVVGRVRCSDSDGVVRRPVTREPLDPDTGGVSPGIPLLREFSSQPIPAFEESTTPDGVIEYTLRDWPVGLTGAITCITGERIRHAGRIWRDAHNPWGEVIAPCYTPCEVLIFEQWLHEDLFGPIEPTLAVYSEILCCSTFPAVRSSHFEMPVTDPVACLGKGSTLPFTPQIPRYPELIDYVFSRAGWDRHRFDLYRVRMEYPPIPASVAMRHDLPEGPSGRHPS